MKCLRFDVEIGERERMKEGTEVALGALTLMAVKEQTNKEDTTSPASDFQLLHLDASL